MSRARDTLPGPKYCVRVRRMLTGSRAAQATRVFLKLVNKIKILDDSPTARGKISRPWLHEVNVASDIAHETGLAGRYANAVFELAREQGVVDGVDGDLQAIKAMMAASAELRRLVKSPVFGHEEQVRALRPVLEKMGVQPLTEKFLLTLAAKRRLFALENVIAAYERLVARVKGEIQAEVTSAHPLNDAQTAELKAMLKAKLGRDPRLNAKVDPTLLGGLVVKVGSRMIDSSLRTKLAGLKAAMRGH